MSTKRKKMIPSIEELRKQAANAVVNDQSKIEEQIHKLQRDEKKQPENKKHKISPVKAAPLSPVKAAPSPKGGLSKKNKSKKNKSRKSKKSKSQKK